MDKPSQTKPYAGLIIYRTQRNVEYLFLNDSFTNKKHWFCPKGQVIGNEEDIKCALRETFEATGLRPSNLRIEEGFAIELKYLSGTKPKKVKYLLAQLLDNHVRLLPNAEGVHMQWFNQTNALEKVIFKSMQDVLKHAQTFIESKQQQNRRKYDRHHSNNIAHPVTASATAPRGNGNLSEIKSSAPVPAVIERTRNNVQHQQQQQQQQQQQSSPLYKTRLCERFETEGSCPYGQKCNFAHGIIELRGRENTQPQQQSQDENDAAKITTPLAPNNASPMMSDSGNQLFKTRLCEKFMKEKFCQYGPKCHFAHGENELKSRPKKVEEPVEPRRMNLDTHDHYADHRNNNNNRSIENTSSTNTNSSIAAWRSNNNYNNHQNNHVNRPSRTRSPSPVEDEVSLPKLTVGRANKESSWRSNLNNPTVSNPAPSASPKTPPISIVAPIVVDKEVLEVKPQDPVISVEELRRPAFVEHQIRSTPTTVVSPSTQKEKKAMVAPVTTEKSWMKVVKLTKEEQDEMNAMQQSNAKTCSPAKSAQTEAIISELKKFFISPSTTADVKEVTKIEMRNDLSKKQLLYILLVSLLEDTEDTLVSILKPRHNLFKTLVKTNADQILLLKAWENFVNQRKPIMVNKTAAALSHWYDCELIEEEAFVQWYDTLGKNSPLETKSAKFMEWLNSSDDEEE